MTKGKYTAKIMTDADGWSRVMVFYFDGEGEVGVPGMPLKIYKTRKAAERGAKAMLAKVA